MVVIGVDELVIVYLFDFGLNIIINIIIILIIIIKGF